MFLRECGVIRVGHQYRNLHGVLTSVWHTMFLKSVSDKGFLS